MKRKGIVLIAVVLCILLAAGTLFASGAKEGVKEKKPVTVTVWTFLNPEGTSMFEPIGGSAPKYAGQGVINPIAAILALGLMLDHLEMPSASARIETAVVKVIPQLKSLSAAKMGYSTGQVGDLIVQALSEQK